MKHKVRVMCNVRVIQSNGEEVEFQNYWIS